MPEPILEKGKIPSQKPEQKESEAAKQPPIENPLAELHQQVGNRAVQRLIQRQGGGEAEVDEETANRIDSSRSGGQALDADVQESMGTAMGADFSDVRVHTSSESDELNAELGAKAFTTGQDVFFSDGAYEPDTADGQELLAHELTHVVQQGSGEAGGRSGPMTVNEPGDAHEQEADSVAETVSRQGVQKQEDDELESNAAIEEDLPVQMQEDDELEEEEAPVQLQEEEELEEEAVQRQEAEEEEWTSA